MKTKFRLTGNRTLIGIICVVLALVITFGVAPLVTKYTEQKVEVVRMKEDVKRGHTITASDVEIASVSSYNLPAGVIKNGKNVVGKVATTDLFAGDYLFEGKLTSESNRSDDVLQTLNGTKVAISVGIASFASGLSDKLENGDIVSAIVYDRESGSSYIPTELKYLRVITATTADGVDKDEKEDGAKSVTVTVLATPEQAELLAKYNTAATIHFALVYRGSTENADKFIKAQDDYLASHPIVNGAGESNE